MTALAEIAETLSAALPFSLDLLLRATIVLGIAQLLLVAFKRRSAASRHLVVTLGFAAIIALPVLMLSLPDARLAVLPSAPQSDTAAAASADGTPLGDWKSGTTPGGSENFGEVARTIASTGIANERALSVATAVLWIGDNWQVLLLIALTLVPMLFLARIAMGMIAVWIVAHRAEPADERWMARELAHATRRLSVKRPVRMLLSDRINVPLVWGFLRPVLILPTSARTWTRDRFRVVILHEVAHVRRFDVLSLMTGRLATSIYWFHPMSWLLERSGRRECERACDDLVLRTGARASDYADHLLGIAAGEDLAESYASVTLAMARPSELEGRLLSILRAEGERAPISRKAASIAAIAAIVMLLPIATVRLTARPTGDDLAAQRPTTEATGTEIEVATEVEPVLATGNESEDEALFEQLVDTTIREEKEFGRRVELTGHKSHKKKSYSSAGERFYAEAYELHSQDRYDEAIAAFRKAIENEYLVGTSMYNIACGYAMKGDVENAVRWIEDAFQNGFTKLSTVEKDSDLDPIRSDPRFRGLMRDLRATYGTSGAKDRMESTLDRFADLRASGSGDAGEWAKVGVDLLRLRQLDDAIFALEEALRLEPDSKVAPYNLACAFALKGDSSRALDALERAILSGFDGGEKLSNDPDLDSIRNDSRFDRLKTMSHDLSLWGRIKDHKSDGHMKLDKREMLRQELPRFESVVAKYPDAGRAWFNLGYASILTENLDRARVAFGRSLDLGYLRATSMYNLACVEALAGNREAALRWLFDAEKEGAPLKMMEKDGDLDSLRDDPRFQELLERARARDDDKHKKEKELQEKKLQEKQAGWI